MTSASDQVRRLIEMWAMLAIAWVNAGWVQTSRASTESAPARISLDSIAPKDKEMPGSDPRLGGTHRTKAPIIRWGKVTVSAGIPAEVVRGVMRQNFGRFHLCYQAGLKRAPKLRGSVALHYIIDLDASVSNVSTEGSTVTDTEVLGCIARAVSGLSFPKPEGAAVKVSFELQLFPPS